MSSTPIRLGELLTQLAERNVPVRTEQPLPAALSGANDAESSPWYVKALVGIAAWIAAFFLGTFFGVAGLIDSKEAMLIWGAILAVGAVVLKRWAHNSIFWGQLAFAFVLAGQGLLVGGFIWWNEEMSQLVTNTAFFVIALELVIFGLYPDALHRMLSVLAMVGALLVVLYDQKLFEAIHAVTLLLASGVVAVWQGEFRLLASRLAPFKAPLGYGFALALFGLCLFSLVSLWEITDWWLSAAALALVLLYLAFTLLRELDRPVFSPVGLWAIGAVALFCVPAYQTPGILAAVMVLVLGYWRGNVLLMGLATVFLLFFLSAYYYNLEITLLNKSYILMGTGLVLLVVRFIFHRLVGEQPAALDG